MNEQQRQRLSGYIGIAQRAGKIAAGDIPAREALRKGRAYLLVMAEDAAPVVQQELKSLAGDNVPILSWSDMVDLGRLVGKSRRGALAVLDLGLAKAMLQVAEISLPSVW